MLDFTVYGVPQPQGSAKAFMRPGGRYPVVTSDNGGLKYWRTAVAAAAQPFVPAGVLERGPVCVDLDFRFVRPPSIPKKRTHHTVRPDLDKLARAVLDALTGIAWVDDSQVCELHVSKGYAAPGFSSGVRVRVESLQPSAPLHGQAEPSASRSDAGTPLPW